MEIVMISLRNLTVISGFAAMALMLVPVAMAAQLAADGAPVRSEAAPAAAAEWKQPDAPRPAQAGAPIGAQSKGGPDSVVRPAAAVPPERIQVEPAPAARPSVAPQDDPRSVEESKGEPDATDR
jgi:hypothetical protein